MPAVGSSRGRTTPALGVVEPSASTWCFATPDERAWWGGLWADRTVGSSFGEGAVAQGLAERTDLEPDRCRVAGVGG